MLGDSVEHLGEVDTLIEPAALDLMAMRPSTPLQLAEHLNRAFEVAPGLETHRRGHRRCHPGA